MITLVSYYVDLAIGLILAFLLLSLLVSGLNEGLVRLLGIRSKFLWAYLRDTLDGGEVVEKVPRVLRWLDARLKGFSRFSRRLRSALSDLLPPPKLIRSRLPATLLGVFAKLPFGKDPRPAFSPYPAPVHSPPLAAAADSLVAAEVKAAESLAGLAETADSVRTAGSAGTGDPAGTTEASGATSTTSTTGTPVSVGPDGSTGAPEAAGTAEPIRTDATAESPLTAGTAGAAGTPDSIRLDGTAEEHRSGTAGGHGSETVGAAGSVGMGGSTGSVLPSEILIASTPADQTLGSLGIVDSSQAAGGGFAGAVAGSAVDSAHGAEHADPREHGESLTDLLHERLQEIDEAKQGKTTIAEIPPSRFSVALLEIASDRGGIEPLLSQLQRLKSPLYRPMAAIWEKSGGTLPSLTPVPPTPATLVTTPPASAHSPFTDSGVPTPGTATAPGEVAAASAVDMEAFRKGVEDWFDGEMTRLTLLYRRYVRWAVGVLSLLVTLLFSMDALEYGKTLLNDNAYRSAVAAFADQGEQALAPIKAQCEPDKDIYTCVTDVLSTPAFVKIFAHAPVSAAIPPSGSPAWTWRGGDWWDRLVTPSHWPGFLLTLVALLFGAPFWWDMFRRVTGLKSRSTTSTTK
ncbi:hypothetical protein ABGB08_22515 [Acrocarpospora sp. B8E8]